MLDHPFGLKIEVVVCYVTKPQYSYKQSSISLFVNQSLQILINSISMVLSESLVYTCEPQAWIYLLWHVSVVHV